MNCHVYIKSASNVLLREFELLVFQTDTHFNIALLECYAA
jgi:hypothetical protein